MKILEIIPQLSSGGAERFVVDLCNEMSREHDVTLVVLHNLDTFGFFVKELNPSVKLISMNKKKGFDFWLLFRLFYKIYLIKPNVIHSHLAAVEYLLLSILFYRKAKFFHTVHNDAEKEAEGGVKKYLRRFYFKFNFINPVTISDESKLSFTNYYKKESILIYNGSVIYNGNLETQRKVREEFGNFTKVNIVNIASLKKQKNQYPLALVIDRLNKKGHNINLYIIGSMGDGIIAKCIEEKKFDGVYLMGTRTNPRDYMAVADAFCLSSIYEGMPITLIECFSVGAIPICTPVGGIKNMIQDGVNGILAQSTSEEDIESAIVRFINLTDDEKQRMREASLASFEQYNMTTCAQKYLRVFN